MKRVTMLSNIVFCNLIRKCWVNYKRSLSLLLLGFYNEIPRRYLRFSENYFSWYSIFAPPPVIFPARRNRCTHTRPSSQEVVFLYNKIDEITEKKVTSRHRLRNNRWDRYLRHLHKTRTLYYVFLSF